MELGVHSHKTLFLAQYQIQKLINFIVLITLAELTKEFLIISSCVDQQGPLAQSEPLLDVI